MPEDLKKLLDCNEFRGRYHHIYKKEWFQVFDAGTLPVYTIEGVVSEVEDVEDVRSADWTEYFIIANVEVGCRVKVKYVLWRREHTGSPECIKIEI